MPNVILGATYWALNGVNIFSVNLVRGLRELGISAHVLLTEEDSALINVTEAFMQRPDDISFVKLPVKRRSSWGCHWGAIIRYLEEQAPCIYIPNSDYRHSCVSPLLSDRVKIIGVVHSDDELHYDHVRRQGKYWDSIVTTSKIIAKKTIKINNTYRERTEVISIGVNIPFERPKPRDSNNGSNRFSLSAGANLYTGYRHRVCAACCLTAESQRLNRQLAWREPGAGGYQTVRSQRACCVKPVLCYNSVGH